jgi:hypothetical protein
LLSAGVDGPGSPGRGNIRSFLASQRIRASPDRLKQINSLLIKKKTPNLSMAVRLHLLEIRDNVTWALAP